MDRQTIFTIATIAIIWIIFTENLSWQNLFIGAALGTFISYFAKVFLPKSKLNPKDTSRIKLNKLITYPFWLILKVYKDAFSLIGAIFSGTKCGIVKEKLKLNNKILRTILANSITQTPGTICIEQEGDEITILCLSNKKAIDHSDSITSLRDIEKRLLKAEHQTKNRPYQEN